MAGEMMLGFDFHEKDLVEFFFPTSRGVVKRKPDGSWVHVSSKNLITTNTSYSMYT